MDHLSQFLVLKDFYHKTLINSNDVLQQNYRFFNNNKFKNELNDISWDNISPDNASVSLVFDLFLARENTLLDTPKYKLSKKLSLKAKPWINKNTQPLMPECDRPFKCYCNENSFALKVANTSKIKIFEA